MNEDGVVLCNTVLSSSFASISFNILNAFLHPLVALLLSNLNILAISFDVLGF